MTKLKIGDKVVMNDRYYDKHQGEVFTIKAGPEMIGRKECFWLDGYDGAYCADGLDLYKPPTNEEWLHTLNTEQLAEELLAWWFDGANTYSQFGLFKWEIDEAKDKITNWLKEKHNGV